MIFNLVLQHAPEVLESLLKSQLKWDRVSGEMDGVGLLVMLRDITHKHDSLVQSTLSYVKTFLEWTPTFQGKHESNTDYYTLFLSRIETIRSHGGEPGFHNGVYQKHLSKLLEKQNMTASEFIAMESARDGMKKRKDLEKKARESACEEFLSCMFIHCHCSDEDRYGQLKKTSTTPIL